jgi:hypothetical protein
MFLNHGAHGTIEHENLLAEQLGKAPAAGRAVGGKIIFLCHICTIRLQIAGKINIRLSGYFNIKLKAFKTRPFYSIFTAMEGKSAARDGKKEAAQGRGV